MGPHTQHFDRVLGLVDLVDEAVLDVNAPRVGAGEVADEPFVGGRVLERVGAQNGEQRLRAGAQARGLEFFRVLAGVPREDELPAYHGSFLAHFETGVFMFLTRESRMPGTDRR